jgi:hypothetical protein
MHWMHDLFMNILAHLFALVHHPAPPPPVDHTGISLTHIGKHHP